MRHYHPISTATATISITGTYMSYMMALEDVRKGCEIKVVLGP